MLTDWLIFLDILEENNYNTSFLRFITPITFGIIKCHHFNYRYGFGSGNDSGDGATYDSNTGLLNQSIVQSDYVYASVWDFVNSTYNSLEVLLDQAQ